MKSFDRIILLFLYCTPFVFLAMNEDATVGSLWFYLVMIIGFGILCYASLLAKSSWIVFVGNILSFISSCIFAWYFQTPKWEYYFKPFLPNTLIIFETVIAFLIQIAFVIHYARKKQRRCKKMKKIISFLSIIAIMFSMTLTTFAGSIPEDLLHSDDAHIFFAEVVYYHPNKENPDIELSPVKVIKGDVKLGGKLTYYNPNTVGDFKVKEGNVYLFTYFDENNPTDIFEVTSYDTSTLKLKNVEGDMWMRFQKHLNNGDYEEAEQERRERLGLLDELMEDAENLPPIENNITEYIIMLVLGILLIPLGIMNIKGNISSIHWYNRTRITEGTRPKYGKLMGIGTVVISTGLIISAIINIILDAEIAITVSGGITLISVIVGVGFMLYAQIKYNKGIF